MKYHGGIDLRPDLYDYLQNTTRMKNPSCNFLIKALQNKI